MIFRTAISLMFLLCTIPACTVAETVPPSDNSDSISWWLSYAVKQAAVITDPACKDEVCGRLGRVQALVGDIDGANASASAIANSQKRVYIHAAAAKAAYQQNKPTGCETSLEQLKSLVLSEKNAAVGIFVNNNVVASCLDCNDIDGAMTVAEKTKDQWSFQKIAAHLILQGELKRADDIISNNIKPSGRDFTFVIAAENCIEKKNLPAAEQIAGRLVDIKFKDRVYEKLGVAFAENGNIEKARTAAGIITDSALKSSIMASIAAYQIKTGDINAGLNTLAEVSSRDHQIKVYTLIAEKQADEGDIDTAVKTIEMMTKIIDETPTTPDISRFGTFDDSFKKGCVQILYLRAAKAAAKMGDAETYRNCIAKAATGVKPIQDTPVWGGVIFAQIIETQLETGDIRGAQETVKELAEDKHNLPRALYSITKAQLDKDDIPGAIATAQKITDTMNKSFSYGMIASALVKKNQLNEAGTFLSNLGDSPREVEAYRQTATAFIETGHGRELINWLRDIPSPQAKVYACIGAIDGIMKIEKNNKHIKSVQ